MEGKSSSSARFILLPRKVSENNGPYVFLSFFFIVFIQPYWLKTALGGFCYLGSRKPNFTLNSFGNFLSFLLQVCFSRFCYTESKSALS